MDFIQIPNGAGALLKDEILNKINALPDKKSGDDVQQYPFLKIRLKPESGDALAGQEIKNALSGKAVRLFKLEYADFKESRAESDSARFAQFEPPNPVDLFKLLYEKSRGEPAPEHLLAAFAELEREVGETE